MWQKIIAALMSSTIIQMLVERVFKALLEWLTEFIEKKKAEKQLKSLFKEKLKEVKNEKDPAKRAAAIDKFLNG